MTAKPKKTKPDVAKLQEARARSSSPLKPKPGLSGPQARGARQKEARRAKGIEIRASLEDDLMSVAEEAMGAESRWHRPRKQRVSLRVDTEVVDWFKAKGPGYQTRMNRVLRTVMMEGKKRAGQG